MTKKRMALLVLGIGWLLLSGLRLMDGTRFRAGVVFAAEPSGGKSAEVDFWTTFRRLFASPEPKYTDQGPQRTEVSGVRGVDQEAKMSEKYNWKAVRQMEEFTVTEAQMFKFLKEGGVGPFFSPKGGGR